MNKIQLVLRILYSIKFNLKKFKIVSSQNLQSQDSNIFWSETLM